MTAERTCSTCGASLAGRRPDARYCSPACRRAAARRREPRRGPLTADPTESPCEGAAWGAHACEAALRRLHDRLAELGPHWSPPKPASWRGSCTTRFGRTGERLRANALPLGRPPARARGHPRPRAGGRAARAAPLDRRRPSPTRRSALDPARPPPSLPPCRRRAVRRRQPLVSRFRRGESRFGTRERYLRATTHPAGRLLKAPLCRHFLSRGDGDRTRDLRLERPAS